MPFYYWLAPDAHIYLLDRGGIFYAMLELFVTYLFCLLSGCTMLLEIKDFTVPFCPMWAIYRTWFYWMVGILNYSNVKQDGIDLMVLYGLGVFVSQMPSLFLLTNNIVFSSYHIRFIRILF